MWVAGGDLRLIQSKINKESNVYYFGSVLKKKKVAKAAKLKRGKGKI